MIPVIYIFSHQRCYVFDEHNRSRRDQRTIECNTQTTSGIRWDYIPEGMTISDAIAIYNGQAFRKEFQSRFFVGTSRGERGLARHSLYIIDVQLTDAGSYQCNELKNTKNTVNTELVIID